MLLHDILLYHETCRKRTRCEVTPHLNLLQRYKKHSSETVKSIYLFVPNKLKISDDVVLSLLETHGLVCLPLVMPSTKEYYCPIQIFGETLVNVHSCLILAVALNVETEVSRGLHRRTGPSTSTLSYLPPNAVFGFSIQRQYPVLRKLVGQVKSVLYEPGLVASIPNDILNLIENRR